LEDPAVKKSLLGWILLCILSTASFSFGQTASTSLRGTIKDPSGALVPGAKITIVDKSNDETLNAVADSTGSYSFPQIPPARYTISVSASGFGDQSKVAELLVNEPATINFTLTIEASTETVDVSASAQTLNTTDATIGNAVGNETIEAMPLDGRDPISLLSLQPGVLYLGESLSLADKTAPQDQDSRQGAVAGARSDQGNVTLDGIDNNDEISGYAFNGVLRSTLDSTEEFRVTTSNANADAGRSSGAQISLVTKSGTNTLHGSLYEYHRPSNTVANDWFVKNQQIADSAPNRPTKYIVNTFGGSVGGPMIKDKLFFFYNYEGQRLATNSTVSAVTPSAIFRNGQLGYLAADGSSVILTRDQIAALDASCTQCAAPGVDQAIVDYLSTEPTATVLAGGDGYNNGTYNFSSPAPQRLNTNIVKFDYKLNAKNHFFARGNLQKDFALGEQNLPGQPASGTLEDNTKGMAFGHTWIPTSNIVNDLRYGYVRQGYSSVGIGTGDYVDIRFLQQPDAHTRSAIVHVPVHSIIDNMSWTKGSHVFSLGGNWRMVQNETNSNENSFQRGYTNPSYLSGSDAPDPTTIGMPAVDPGYGTSFDYAYATIIGDIAEWDTVGNYVVTSPTTGTLQPDGAFIKRQFKTNEFEYFLQDSWRVRPNLTLTFGLRHTLLQTPYETRGQQVAPTVDTHEWFVKRGEAAAKGQVFEDDLFFSPNGKANGKPGFWPKEKLNIAPRIAIVYSPDAKTAIRSGFGIYYDHYGEALTSQFARRGSFGLSSQFQSAPNSVSYETAPHFTGPRDMPTTLPGNISPPTQTYPYAVPDGSFGINWGIDNHVHTPYTEAFNLSIQREVPGGFLVEVSYVGRIGRHLFQQLDLAEPVDYNDPQGAGDYFTAGTQMSKFSDSQGGNYGDYKHNSLVRIPAIQYFEDVFPQMQSIDYPGQTATEYIYNYEWAPQRYSYGETGALYDIDFACAKTYGCIYPKPIFWNSQFSSLLALSSIGNSYYNAAQVTIRHPARHGLSMDFSYTLSRSIDQGSDAERSNTSYGAIQNVWNPALSRGLSDFDTKHLLTVDWAYSLPFGRGKAFGANSGKLGDAIWGGWQWAGLGRWTSGLPFGLIEPGWTTNWELQAWAVTTAPVKVRKHIQGGLPQVFDDPKAISDGVTTGSPIRLPYPGEAGMRNNFRGDGVFDIDSSMSKNWNLGERTKMKFAWEVYNVTNSVRFDDQGAVSEPLGNALTYPGFGFYSTTLGTHTFRRMQFGLRLDF
jgi:hypothetical protein